MKRSRAILPLVFSLGFWSLSSCKTPMRSNQLADDTMPNGALMPPEQKSTTPPKGCFRVEGHSGPDDLWLINTESICIKPELGPLAPEAPVTQVFTFIFRERFRILDTYRSEMLTPMPPPCPGCYVFAGAEEVLSFQPETLPKPEPDLYRLTLKKNASGEVRHFSMRLIPPVPGTPPVQ